MRIFLDANVIFSAAQSTSNLAKLIELVLQQHTAVTSDFALEEARRNIELKRPQWKEGFAALVPRLELAASVQFDLPVELVEKDRPILCTAIRSQCELLVTGDRRHFGELYDQTVAGVTIVSTLGLAERLLGNDPKENQA
jgi:uncharacterized protein